MTEQEAITVLNCIEAHGSLPRKAKAKAIEALEKQMNSEQQTGLSAVENDGQLNIEHQGSSTKIELAPGVTIVINLRR